MRIIDGSALRVLARISLVVALLPVACAGIRPSLPGASPPAGVVPDYMPGDLELAIGELGLGG